MKSLIILGILITSNFALAVTEQISTYRFLSKHKETCLTKEIEYKKKMNNFGKDSSHFNQDSCHNTAIELIEDITGQSVVDLKGSKIRITAILESLTNKCNKKFIYDSSSSLEAGYANFYCKEAATEAVGFFLEQGLKDAISFSELINRKEQESQRRKTIDERNQQDKRITPKERAEFQKAIRAN